jgi:hypothetical protein
MFKHEEAASMEPNVGEQNRGAPDSMRRGE